MPRMHRQIQAQAQEERTYRHIESSKDQILSIVSHDIGQVAANLRAESSVMASNLRAEADVKFDQVHREAEAASTTAAHAVAVVEKTMAHVLPVFVLAAYLHCRSEQ